MNRTLSILEKKLNGFERIQGCAREYIVTRFSPFLPKTSREFFFDFLFSFSFCLYAVMVCLDQTTISSCWWFGLPETLLKAISALLAFSIVLLNVSPRVFSLAACFTIFLISLLSYLFSGSGAIFYLVLFVVAAKDRDIRSTLRTLVPTLAVATLVIMGISVIGLIDSRTVVEYNTLLQMNVPRRSFGFIHQNHLGHVVFTIFIAHLVSSKKLTIFSVVLWVFVSVVMFFVVSTKTTALTILFGVLIWCIVRGKRSASYLGLIICTWLVCMVIAFVILFGFGFGWPLSVQIDGMLAHRFRSVFEFLLRYPVTLFGQKLHLVSMVESAQTGAQPFVLDNAYAHLLLRYGLFSFVVVMSMYILCIMRAFENKDASLLVSVCIILFVGFLETWPFALCGTALLICSTGDMGEAAVANRHDETAVSSDIS